MKFKVTCMECGHEMSVKKMWTNEKSHMMIFWLDKGIQLSCACGNKIILKDKFSI